LNIFQIKNDQNISRITASEEYKVGQLNAELRRMSGEVYNRLNQYEIESGKSVGSHQLLIVFNPGNDRFYYPS
jgi:hypothetical protein